MMTSLLLALTLTSLKLEAVQFQAPKLELDLPGVPKVEGLRRPTAKDATLTSRKAEATGTLRVSPAQVEQVQVGRSFVTTSRGLTALEPLDTFLVANAPAVLPPFKVCVRVSSADRMPTRVKLQLQLPGGGEFVSLSKSVSFDEEWTDVVFDLASLKVSHGGAYQLVVSLDGAQASVLPLQVRVLKQAAESSGR